MTQSESCGMNRNHHARRRRRGAALAAVHFVISVKLLVPRDKEGGEFIILRGRKTKQNDAEPDPETREQIGLQAVTNGARRVHCMTGIMASS